MESDRQIKQKLQGRIDWIKTNLPTRNRWSKQDYSDFYFRDVTFLLEAIGYLQKREEKA